MMIRRWVRFDYRSTRYYITVVTDYLFGGWNLQRFWGGCDSRRGGQLSQHLDDPELRLIARRRQQRGYVPAVVD